MDSYLKQHPSVFMSERKEPHFFAKDLNFRRDSWYVSDQDEYLSLFSEAGNARRVGESSVWYLYSRQASTEIKAFCPDASIIVMLRNPVDMLYSQHSQFLYNGNEDITDFKEALEAEPERKQGRRVPPNAHLLEGLFYRETARYSEQVERYFDCFGRDNVHVIIFDNFATDTATVYRDTLRFLGVDADFRPDFAVVNPNKTARSRILQYFLLAPPQSARRFARAVLPRALRRRVFRVLKQANTNETPRTELDPQLRRTLQAEFAPEVESLSKLLGRDLTHWLKD